MATCPACGFQIPAPPPEGVPAGAARCSRCGADLASAARNPPQRTMLGGVAPFTQTIPMTNRSPSSQKTLMGVSSGSLGVPNHDPARDPSLVRTQVIGTPRTAGAARGNYDPLTDPHQAMATIVDVPAFAVADALRSAAGSPSSKPQGTLLGVARPGIAPLRPGVAKTPIDTGEPLGSYEPLGELGATQKVSREVRDQVRARYGEDRRAHTHPLAKLRVDGRKIQRAKEKPAAAAPPRSSTKKALIVIGAAVLLTGLAIGVAFLWPSASPLRAQVRAAEGGTEVLDLFCDSCPDGTILKVRDREADVEGKKATVPLGTPLAIGDTLLKVAVERPNGGRKETVTLPVRVAYRIRPDVTTLDGDFPSIQIVVEAMDGATVTLDGEDIAMHEGRAVKTVDVRKDLEGESADVTATLSRKVSFVVKPPDGEEEKGSVSISVPIAPLTIDAPGPAIVTEKPTFLLAGHSLPGAEIIVARRSIGSTKDGAFSQTMNVSSVGATEIEVRARMPARAPRLVKVAVERVTNLDAAATAFAAKNPASYPAFAATPGDFAGKPAMLSGEIVDLRSAPSSITLLIRPDAPECAQKTCLARATLGKPDTDLARGDVVRVFGTLKGAALSDGASVPDLAGAFFIRDKRGADASKPGTTTGSAAKTYER